MADYAGCRLCSPYLACWLKTSNDWILKTKFSGNPDYRRTKMKNYDVQTGRGRYKAGGCSPCSWNVLDHARSWAMTLPERVGATLRQRPADKARMHRKRKVISEAHSPQSRPLGCIGAGGRRASIAKYRLQEFRGLLRSPG